MSNYNSNQKKSKLPTKDSNNINYTSNVSNNSNYYYNKSEESNNISKNNDTSSFCDCEYDPRNILVNKIENENLNSILKSVSSDDQLKSLDLKYDESENQYNKFSKNNEEKEKLIGNQINKMSKF